MKKALIIGGGMAGCSMSHMLQLLGGWDVTLIEKNNFLGAGVRTSWYGGHPFTYGPRHFLTENEKVYEYFNTYCPLRDCSEHEFLTYVEQDNAFYNFPIHKADIALMPDKEIIYKELGQAELANSEVRFDPAGIQLEGGKLSNVNNLEEFWIKSVGVTLYEKFVKYYTQKMWMVTDNKQIDNFGWSPKGVTIKEGSRESWDTAISAYPIAEDGYNKYFDLSTQESNILLNTTIQEYDIPNNRVKITDEWFSYDIIINTISPDIIMNNIYGELPYIGRDIIKIVLPLKFVFPGNVYFLYYAGKQEYTRIVEYKKLTRQNLDISTSLISIEFISKNGKYYPLPFKSEISKAKKYLDDLPDSVFSIGRAGSYDYGVDIDDAIEQAMEVINSL